MKKLILTFIVFLLIFNCGCDNSVEKLTTREKMLNSISDTLSANEYVLKVEYEEAKAPDIALVWKKIYMTDDFYKKTIKEQYFIIKLIYDEYKKIVGTDSKYDETFKICKEGNKRYTYSINDDFINIISYDEKLNISELEENPNILDKYSIEKIANDTGYVDNQTNTTSAYTLEPTDEEKSYAWAVAEKEVKQKLKSPSTAKFPFSYNGQHIKKTYDNKFQVISYVDAENSFGATVRIIFTVEFEKTGNETYNLINVTLVE